MGNHGVVRPLVSGLETAAPVTARVMRKAVDHGLYATLWDAIARAATWLTFDSPLAALLVLFVLFVGLVAGGAAIWFWRKVSGVDPAGINGRNVMTRSPKARLDFSGVSPFIDITVNLINVSGQLMKLNGEAGGHVRCNGHELRATAELVLNGQDVTLNLYKQVTVTLRVWLTPEEAALLRPQWEQGKGIEFDLTFVHLGVIVDHQRNGHPLRLDLDEIFQTYQRMP